MSTSQHERLVIAAGLAVMVALSWVYLWRGAGMGMSALQMTAFSLFPHLHDGAVGGMSASWPVVICMWFVMMVAMMTPSVAPLVLLYGAVLRRHSGSGGDGNAYLATASVLAGYLAVWFVFSVAAAAAQKALEPTGLISTMMLWSRSAALSATVLFCAGVYQLSPLKRRCLSHCRHPASFLTRHWRPGLAGSFALGVNHGAFCLGCCWVLMALLFVGGIMNLVWIAALTAIVVAEKLLPSWVRMRTVTGCLLIAWAGATLLV